MLQDSFVSAHSSPTEIRHTRVNEARNISVSFVSFHMFRSSNGVFAQGICFVQCTSTISSRHVNSNNNKRFFVFLSWHSDRQRLVHIVERIVHLAHNPFQVHEAARNDGTNPLRCDCVCVYEMD